MSDIIDNIFKERKSWLIRYGLLVVTIIVLVVVVTLVLLGIDLIA